MKATIRILFLFVLFIGAFACTRDSDELFVDENGQPIKNDNIKSILSGGQTNRKFLYDSFGRIREDQGLYFFYKYSYDKNGRLEKVETAIDFNTISSSSIQAPKTELMTSANCTINHYRTYQYDKEGRLSKIENYFIKTGKKFELTSISTFEYEGKWIIKENGCDEKGTINQYYVFTNDEKGNIINEKNYICMFTGLSNPQLNYESIYQYDNYKNPYQVLNKIGPKFYTSANNMVEMTTKWYLSDPRTSVAKQSFKYNNKGYPEKMIYDGGEEEYTY